MSDYSYEHLRIGGIQAKEGLTENLREFLLSIMPMIKSSEGCESVQLYQNQADVTKFIIIEVWNGVDSHQASVRNIPSDKLGEISHSWHPHPAGVITA